MSDAERIDLYQRLARNVMARHAKGSEEYDAARAVLWLAGFISGLERQVLALSMEAAESKLSFDELLEHEAQRVYGEDRRR